jgi:retinol dehydrogenase 12
MCGRNESKATAAIEMLKQVTGKDNICFLKLDLVDLHSCAAAANDLLSKEAKLDILILNAYFIFSFQKLIMEKWSILYPTKFYQKSSRL